PRIPNPASLEARSPKPEAPRSPNPKSQIPNPESRVSVAIRTRLSAGVRLADSLCGRRHTVHVDDLDISPSKIGETAQRIVDRAIEEARRREHALLTNEHIFLAFAQVEWDMFAEFMRDIELNPHTILQAIEEHLHMMPSFAGRELRVSPATKLVF